MSQQVRIKIYNGEIGRKPSNHKTSINTKYLLIELFGYLYGMLKSN